MSPLASTGKSIKVAVLQLEPLIGEIEVNVRAAVEGIRRAAGAGADVVVLPELCTTGYCLADYSEAHAWSESAESGRTASAWGEAAREGNVYVVGGILEKNGRSLYNSAVLIGPDGYVGTYRKTHLFGREKLFFTPGDLGLPAFQLPFGRIGILICYDIRFFEVVRILALLGVELICVPTNWVLGFDQKVHEGFAMQNYVAMTAANLNQVFMACASRVGTERDTAFLGRSIIVGPSGWPLKGPASADRTELLLANVELGQAVTAKIKSDFNDVLRDRRTDIYEDMLGYNLEKRYVY